jgi:hypothetical protein
MALDIKDLEEQASKEGVPVYVILDRIVFNLTHSKN